jgi:hypothetical protein
MTSILCTTASNECHNLPNEMDGIIYMACNVIFLLRKSSQHGTLNYQQTIGSRDHQQPPQKTNIHSGFFYLRSQRPSAQDSC